MQITFNSYEEMMEFMEKMKGNTPEVAERKKTEPAQMVQTAPATQPAQTTVPAAPTVPVAPTSAPAPASAAPVTPVTTAATAPTAPVAPQREYTLDELAGAAMQLMDKGGQAQLQSLLAGYGVEALPQLPKEQYGNFATALRGMGAQI